MSKHIDSGFAVDIRARLPELVQKFETPFHIYSKPGIKQAGERMIKAFSGVPYRQYFAVKACPEPWIMEFLFKELGFGFDCSSIPEVIMARALGARGEDIMFTSNDTSPAEFEVALDNDIILNLDDISFLDPLSTTPELICFRINPGRRRTGNTVIGNPYDAKYGITYDQIIPAYKTAMELGAKRFGIHMMICSNQRHSSYFVKTAQACLEIADLLDRELGIRVEFINIGGGFGIPYQPKDKEINLEWVGQKITKLFRDYEHRSGFMPKLMTECGRYIAGPYGVLVNKVLHTMQKYQHFVGVEAAMSGCPRPAFYGSYHHIDVLSPDGKLRTGRRHFTNVVGPKCENWDRLTAVDKPRLLPVSVKRDDLLITHKCGAHSGAMADNYNGRTRLKGLLDQDGTNENVIVIREAEKIGDLFRNIVKSPNFELPGQE
jgi:diaminopimelate decarboxylase